MDELDFCICRCFKSNSDLMRLVSSLILKVLVELNRSEVLYLHLHNWSEIETLTIFFEIELFFWEREVVEYLKFNWRYLNNLGCESGKIKLILICLHCLVLTLSFLLWGIVENYCLLLNKQYNKSNLNIMGVCFYMQKKEKKKKNWEWL